MSGIGTRSCASSGHDLRQIADDADPAVPALEEVADHRRAGLPLRGQHVRMLQ
ncbi:MULTISPECIES: hypothetical protein [Microbacterium]|uniref:hypothetical protein n=1 Tax=Microbacterium TaxID=33882 RepID=UPI00217CF9A3|nr:MULTISPECIES: hypothetical protein [Microbacterium]UWF76835.1 hypothetical protein JSY13_08280 [Microbacterium neungamense]WCM54990.1 hypothetical protein JRG78_08275 [Microbacterium sp. EF45047]